MDSSTAFFLIVVSAGLDIVANLLMKKSDGFRHKLYGIGGIVVVWVAFGLLAQVSKVMDLAVAYALWGALAILGTAISARILFGQKINRIGWLGIVLILASVVILKTA